MKPYASILSTPEMPVSRLSMQNIKHIQPHAQLRVSNAKVVAVIVVDVI